MARHKYKLDKPRLEKKDGPSLEQVDRILAALDTVSAAHDATPAQVALAWLMAQPAVAAPIASATSLDQLTALASLPPGSCRSGGAR